MLSFKKILLIAGICTFTLLINSHKVLAGPQCTATSGVCKALCDTATEDDKGALDCTAPDGKCCAPKSAAAATPATAAPTAPATPETETVIVAGDCKTDVGGIGFPCPLGERNVPRIVGSLIRWVLGLIGALFFLMFLYGGFMYIIAGESAKNAETGQKTIINAVIGMAIVIGSYIVLGWIVGIFTSAGGGVVSPVPAGQPSTPSAVTCTPPNFCMTTEEQNQARVGGATVTCNTNTCDTGRTCCSADIEL